MNSNADNADNALRVSQKIGLSSLILLCNITVGFSFNVLGPTLLDIEALSGIKIGSLAYGLTAAGISYSFGALICGWLYGKLNRQLIMAQLFIMAGFATTLIPKKTSLTSFIANEIIVGFCSGGIDTATSAWILEIWGIKSTTMFAATGLFYSGGIFLSSVTSQHFASADAVSPGVSIPYEFAGGWLMMTGVTLIACYFVNKYEPPRIRSDRQTNEGLPLLSARDHHSGGGKLAKFSLGALLLCSTWAFQGHNVLYLSTFISKSRGDLPKNMASLMTTAMNGSLAMSCLLFVFISTRIKSLTMTKLGATVQSGALVLLAISFLLPQMVILCTSVILLGIGFPLLTAPVFAIVEERIPVTNGIASALLCTNSVYYSLSSYFIGNNIENHPFILLYWNIFNLTVIAILIVIMSIRPVSRVRSVNDEPRA